MKQLNDAYKAFQQSLDYLPEELQISAYEELAKIAEHARRDFTTAIEKVEDALKLIEQSSKLKALQKIRLKESFDKRLKRNKKKQTISRGSADFDRK